MIHSRQTKRHRQTPHSDRTGILSRVLLVLLAILIAGVLFPEEWLGLHWRPLGSLLSTVFSGPWQHAIGHTTLFFFLGLLVGLAVPPLRRRPLLYFALLAVIALGQESFQLVWKQRALAF